MNKFLFMTEVAFGSDSFSSCRILNPEEVQNLTQEAIEHLIDLKSKSLLSDMDFEDLLLDVSSIHQQVVIDLDCLKKALEFKGITDDKIVN